MSPRTAGAPRSDSVGTVKGRAGHRKSVKRDVRLPATVAPATAHAAQVPLPPLPLGNLLCGITGALDQNALATTPLGQLAQILNSLPALSPHGL